MRKHKWALGFSACLLAFTVFLSLDTFVLSSAYQENATQMNTAMFERVTSEKSDESGEEPEAAAEDAADTTEPQAETTPQENTESSGKKHKARRTSAEEAVQETSEAPTQSSPPHPLTARTRGRLRMRTSASR